MLGGLWLYCGGPMESRAAAWPVRGGPMAAAESPTVRQRRLRVELRRSRDGSGLTQDQVAESLDWSLSKVIRIESGAVNISTTDLRALLSLYGVAEERIAELVTLARAARERAWWSGYKKVISQQYYDLIGYESAAAAIRQFEPLVIPGLLQTQEYAHAYISGIISPSAAATSTRWSRSGCAARRSSNATTRRCCSSSSTSRPCGGRSAARA
ncbi:helix-turn-helix domain-containing protein [Actinomadura sp. J1-007]|nr:helix-turn-helix domain-containing protein [Actinomadura sp. J1-007]